MHISGMNGVNFRLNGKRDFPRKEKMLVENRPDFKSE